MRDSWWDATEEEETERDWEERDEREEMEGCLVRGVLEDRLGRFG